MPPTPLQQKRITDEVEEEINKKIENETKRIEKQSHCKAKGARLDLEEAVQIQESTNQELERQGEKICNAKRSALRIYENAENADELADNIEKERKLFNIGIPFYGRIKKWWNKSGKEKKELNSIREGLDTEESETGMQEEEEPSEEVEEAEGDDEKSKTDRELKLILKNLQKINKGAKIHSKIMNKQEKDLNDINKINDYSKKKMEDTDDRLKKK